MIDNDKYLTIKCVAGAKGVRLYEIPPKLGIGMSTFQRMTIRGLTQSEFKRIMEVIDEISSEKAAKAAKMIEEME